MSEKNMIIRLETKDDYRAVENLTREAFWMFTGPAAWSTMCCTVIEMIRHLCRSWTSSWK